MTPVEWDGDITVAENGDAFGMNRAALTAMRYAAHHEKQTDTPAGYDVDEAVHRLFAGIERAVLDLCHASFVAGMRSLSSTATDATRLEAIQDEDRQLMAFLTLLHEAERSIRRHIER